MTSHAGFCIHDSVRTIEFSYGKSASARLGYAAVRAFRPFFLQICTNFAILIRLKVFEEGAGEELFSKSSSPEENFL
jgi:hypothetical protein